MAIALIGKFFIILFIYSCTDAKRTFNIYQRVCIAKSLNSWSQVNCTIENPINSIPLLNFHYTTENDIPNVYGNVHIIIKRPNQKPFSFLKVPKINICQLAAGAFGLKLANRFLAELQRHGNFPTTCPVKRGHYYIDKLIVNPEIFPEYVNNLTFQARLTSFMTTKDNKEHNLVSVRYDGEVIKTAGKPFIFTIT